MLKKIFLTCLALFFVGIAQSHEFWLQPKKFRYILNEEAKIDLLVGENFEGEPWDLKKNKIEKLDLHHLAKVTDVRTSVKPDAKEKFTLKLTEEGTQLITLQSNYSFIALDADKFNAYLEEDGLEDIYAKRTKANELSKPAKEYYARFVKLLIQTGDKTDNTFKKKTGMRVEIIPEQNPYLLKTGDYLQCTVWYDGKLMPHQLVKVWSKIGNTTFLQNIYTENDGTIKFPISTKGPWMVSTVKMIRSEKPDADWQSMWGSLVFGIE